MNTVRKLEHLRPLRFPLLFLLLLAGAANLHAQSNQTVDRLLDEKPAAFGDAAYVILTAVGFVNESATGEEATAAVADRKLLPATPAATAPVTLGYPGDQRRIVLQDIPGSALCDAGAGFPGAPEGQDSSEMKRS